MEQANEGLEKMAKDKRIFYVIFVLLAAVESTTFRAFVEFTYKNTC